VADAVAPRGGSWGANDTIVFAPTAGSALLEVSANGGPTRAVTTLDRDRGEGGHRWPDYLPDGKTIVFAAGPSTTNTSWSEARISLVQVDTGNRMDLVPRGTYPRYVNGRLFYLENATLLVRSLDPARPTAASESVTVLEHVAQGGNGAGQVALSDNGSLAFASGTTAQTPAPLVWVNRRGIEETLSVAPGVYAVPRLSPDGRRIAVTASSDNSDIWVYDLDRGTSTRLTSEGGNLWPAWTRDGTRIAFSSNRQGSSSLFWTRTDGDRKVERLTTTDTIHAATSWSPAGDVLLLMSVNAASNTDIQMLNRTTGKVVPFVQTPAAERQAMFSPDGRLVAYVSNQNGPDEVFVREFSDGERHWQISNDSGIEPMWAPSGKELFYRRGDDMMVVDIATSPVFTPGKPRRLFTGRYANAQPAGYDVSSDGSRFLMVKDTSAGPLREVRVILNWLDQLQHQPR
jgi:Tol biopolymer transport system component